MALTAPALYSRVRSMLPEMIKFGVVGGLGTVIDLGGAAVLQGKYHVEPLAAKAVSVSLAMVLTYLGSRFWTFRERENQAVHREAVLFFALNIIGLLIAEAVIGLVTYVMGLHGGLAYNAASFVGTGFGTIFRFWAYRKWVFLEPEQSAAEMTAAPDAPAFPDYPPWELDPNFLAPAEAATAPAPVIATTPFAAPTSSAPWHQAPAAAAWDPSQAPTMSWAAPALESASAPQQPALQPAPVPEHDFFAPDLRHLSGPPPEPHRPAPTPTRPPRSSGGGRHRKH